MTIGQASVDWLERQRLPPPITHYSDFKTELVDRLIEMFIFSYSYFLIPTFSRIFTYHQIVGHVENISGSISNWSAGDAWVRQPEEKQTDSLPLFLYFPFWSADFYTFSFFFSLTLSLSVFLSGYWCKTNKQKSTTKTKETEGVRQKKQTREGDKKKTTDTDSPAKLAKNRRSHRGALSVGRYLTSSNNSIIFVSFLQSSFDSFSCLKNMSI